VAILPDLVPRHAQSLVSEALADTRVVLVNGARQAGKSTLSTGGPGSLIQLDELPIPASSAG
jgi:uncharacterized protein